MPTADSSQDVDIEARIAAAVAPLQAEIGRLTETIVAAKSTIRTSASGPAVQALAAAGGALPPTLRRVR